MLAIACALMMQPRLLVLDESTLGLAPVILEQLSHALETLRTTTPITVLLDEQNVTFAELCWNLGDAVIRRRSVLAFW